MAVAKPRRTTTKKSPAKKTTKASPKKSTKASPKKTTKASPKKSTKASPKKTTKASPKKTTKKSPAKKTTKKSPAKKTTRKPAAKKSVKKRTKKAPAADKKTRKINWNDGAKKFYDVKAKRSFMSNNYDAFEVTYTSKGRKKMTIYIKTRSPGPSGNLVPRIITTKYV